jgi:hypothetical protein
VEDRENVNFILMDAVNDDVRKPLDLRSPYLAELGRVMLRVKGEAT